MTRPELAFRAGTATPDELRVHLQACSANFTPRLEERVELGAYARKLAERSVTFEAWDGRTLVGLVAAYFNDEVTKRGFVTSVSTLSTHMGLGVGKRLMDDCIAHGRSLGFRTLALEVHPGGTAAIQLYARCGFVATSSTPEAVNMELALAPR